MAQLRIMNWNIERVGWNKLVTDHGCEPIARVIVQAAPDVVCLLEVCNDDGLAENTLSLLCDQIREIAEAAGDPWPAMGFLLAPKSGTERYAFIVRDTRHVWPLVPTGNRGAPLGPVILHDLNRYISEASGAAHELNWTRATAGDRHFLGWFPLVDMHANSRTGRTEAITTGQSLAAGGTSEGKGYRLACLGMFRVAAEGQEHLIPIVVTHFAAKDSMAATQMADLVYLHIAQLYLLNAQISVENRRHTIDNLIYTGDFNVDFLAQGRQSETSGYSVLTRPPAPAEPLGAGAKRKRAAEVPNVTRSAPPTLGLVPAVHVPTHLIPPTYEGTRRWDGLKDHCFDNLFFGGPALSQRVDVNVMDLPRLIGRGEIDVWAMANHYASLPGEDGTHRCKTERARPLLNRRGITADAALIGARLISDHLPVVVTFQLP